MFDYKTVLQIGQLGAKRLDINGNFYPAEPRDKIYSIS
jgi:hypothetical protein